MPVIEPKRMLSGLKVWDAMRRLTVSMPADASIEQAIRCTIKHKTNALLITDKKMDPIGVISKTNIMGAYYAGIPISAPVQFIMSTPPLFCNSDDTLDQALNMMREKQVHRLYVPIESGREVGVLSYPDVLGLLYRYCCRCERNILRQHRLAGPDGLDLLRIQEVMTTHVRTLDEDDTLMRVMEDLAEHGFGALLITWEGVPTGVISKTDLILAFMHGVPTTEIARTVMHTPVRSCPVEADLVQAIRTMIYGDVHRVFVHQGHPTNIVGVFTLSDAAQARSGSCHACTSSRIEVT